MRLEARDYHAIAAVDAEVAEAVGKLAAHRMSGARGLQSLAAEQRPPRAIVVGHGWDTDMHRTCGASSTATRSRSSGSRPTCRTPQGAGAARCRADDDLPTIRVIDGKTVVRPRLRRVAELLGLGTEAGAAEYDTVIVGAGPAGLAAAVYGASEGLRTIVVEREAPGGQAGTSSRIENYLGFPSGVSGDELASRALQQARRLGAEILVTRSIERIDPATRQVHLDEGDVLRAKTIILASGVAWRQPGHGRAGPARRARASPTARRAARRPTRTASTCTSSARATPRARRRCSSRPTPAASPIVCRGDRAGEEHVALPRRPARDAVEHRHAAAGRT